jgi:hypothetical protein
MNDLHAPLFSGAPRSDCSGREPLALRWVPSLLALEIRTARWPAKDTGGNSPAHSRHAQVRVDLRPTSKGAGFPTPVPAEAGSVPSHEGLGADNRDGP